MNDAEKMGLPVFVSEFGACMNDEACVHDTKWPTDVCEDKLVGWSYWQFKTYKDLTTIAFDKPEGFYFNNGTTKDILLKPLTRPYVQVA